MIHKLSTDFAGALGEETLSELARLIKTRLKKMQHGPQLISGFITKPGLGERSP
jgi:hypothetical protein